jgi:hypothetical protein
MGLCLRAQQGVQVGLAGGPDRPTVRLAPYCPPCAAPRPAGLPQLDGPPLRGSGCFRPRALPRCWPSAGQPAGQHRGLFSQAAGR